MEGPADQTEPHTMMDRTSSEAAMVSTSEHNQQSDQSEDAT